MMLARSRDEIEPFDCVDGRQRCHYCSRPMTRRKDGMTPEQLAMSATKDHKQPKALGGVNEPSNYVICCARDNGLKGHIPYTVFKIFADMVLIPYPDLPTPILRNSLTIYIMHLLERAVSQNRKAMRDACSMSLLSLVDELKNYEVGKKGKRR